MSAADPFATRRPTEPACAEFGPPGYSRQKNFLLNLPSFLKCRLPAAWAGSLRGLPACVCGTFLRDGSTSVAPPHETDGIIIIAPDVALQPLAQLGVQVDYALVTCFSNRPEEFLPDELPPLFVVLGADSPPAWRACVPGDRVVYLSGAHPAETWLAQRGLGPTPVAADADAGATALNLAHFLGCDPILAIGFGPDRETPARPTLAPSALRKRAALARLTSPAAGDTETARAFRAEIGAFGARGWGVLPALSEAWERGMVAQEISVLRSLLSDDAAAAALGTSLEQFAALAEGRNAPQTAGALLEQLEQLCSLAEGLYDNPAD